MLSVKGRWKDKAMEKHMHVYIPIRQWSVS